MDLIYECTYRAELDPHEQMVGPGPFGTRVVSTVTGGWCKGERLNGAFVGAAAEWMLIGSDGFARLDVRAQLVTADSAVIFVSYQGLLEMNDRVMASAGGGETQFEHQYFRSLMHMETGAPDNTPGSTRPRLLVAVAWRAAASSTWSFVSLERTNPNIGHSLTCHGRCRFRRPGAPNRWPELGRYEGINSAAGATAIDAMGGRPYDIDCRLHR